MRILTIKTFAVALTCTLVAFTGNMVHAQSAESHATPTVSAHNVPGGIEWLTFEEAVKRNEKTPKKFIIDVYTDWCGWCKRMDATTFVDPVIVKNIKENYYAVKMDGEQKEDITFMGRTYKYIAQGRRGYHELPAELMNGKMSYPTIVFLDEQYNIIQPIPGYRQPVELDPILTYFGGNYYKNTDWENFQKEYKSPFAQ